MKHLAVCVAGMFFLATNCVAEDWNFAVGTGLGSNSIDADSWDFKDSANNSVNIQGKMDADEMREYTDSGAGLAFSASNRDWTLQASFGNLKLEDDNGATNDWEWTRRTTQLTGIYNFSRVKNNTFGVLAGVVSTHHELEAAAGTVSAAAVDVDESWTDIIVGLAHSMRINKELIWSSRFDMGSEGRRYIDTGVNFVLADHFIIRTAIARTVYDYDNGSKASGNYYAYDADETGLTLGLSYAF